MLWLPCGASCCSNHSAAGQHERGPQHARGSRAAPAGLRLPACPALPACTSVSSVHSVQKGLRIVCTCQHLLASVQDIAEPSMHSIHGSCLRGQGVTGWLQILETKIRKLEQLVRLKDAKIQTLLQKLQAAGVQ